MKQISFDGIGAVVATFEAAEGVAGGQAVKIGGNGRVEPCSAGDSFAGVALEPRNGLAAVQVKGFCTVTGSGLKTGRARLVADGKGGVKPAGSAVITPGQDGNVTVPAAEGAEVLVVSVETDGTAVICL